MDLTPRTFSESVVVSATPEEVYAAVSDVTRMGEWSPICKECWWDEDEGPRVGAQFTGRNVDAGRTWETRSKVVAAEPGREFAWLVGAGYVRWGYTMEPVEGGTELTESWEFTPAGLAFFQERYGDKAAEVADARTKAAHEGIPATLAAIKQSLEGA
jgi:hypothetical protein